MKRAVWTLAVALVLAGCGVSRQVVEEKDAELSAARQLLETCQGELEKCADRFLGAQSDLDACQRESGAKLEECNRELARVRTELDAANRELSSTRKEAEEARRREAALKQREDELRARLQQEIDSKDVEIQNLRGRLSIRVLDRILFASGSAQILPAGQKVLDKLASVLKGSSEMIRVEGHTDDVPIGPGLKEKYFSNWELSAARASSVVRYFQFRHELTPGRMEAVGLSMYAPATGNETAEGRQKNRRVEVVLSAAR